jgi:mRNA interferase HigB
VVRIIARSRLREFWSRETRFSDAQGPLEAWFAEAKKAAWRTPAQVKAQFRNASILRNSRVVFNIAGNKYRLIVHVRYDLGIVFIRFIGTHAEYDRIEAGVV